MAGINPKYLNVEKKVQYNIRLNQRLIDKITTYAELTGNTTTNIINTVLNDFFADKVVLNNYLDNIGGVAVRIPYAIKQKKGIIRDADELTGSFTNDIYVKEYPSDIFDVYEDYLSGLFEVKKIPNNLDIFIDDSYVANAKLFNPKNTIHSGIELFVYNLTDLIFENKSVDDDFNSFINCLYCIYFEVSKSNKVNIYLIDYIHAINLLSASGNNEYKELIIACAKELEKVDDLLNKMYVEYEKEKQILDGENFNQVMQGLPYIDESDDLEDKILEKYKKLCETEISKIADIYNSNNIIPFGTDVFDKMTVKTAGELKSNRINELIDENTKMKNNLIDILKRIEQLEKK